MNSSSPPSTSTMTLMLLLRLDYRYGVRDSNPHSPLCRRRVLTLRRTPRVMLHCCLHCYSAPGGTRTRDRPRSTIGLLCPLSYERVRSWLGGQGSNPYLSVEGTA